MSHECGYITNLATGQGCHYRVLWLIGSAALDHSVFSCPTHLNALAAGLSLTSNGSVLTLETVR